MQPIFRVLVASALLYSSSLLAQELTVSALKAFTAEIDAATASCDLDTVVAHVSPLAVISITKNEQGTMRTLRLNKTQYGELLKLACRVMSSYDNQRTNEKISIDRDQATITADVVETMVVDGREFKTQTRERATVESIDGKLMVTQIVANQIQGQ
jgi:hypothetical protein